MTEDSSPTDPETGRLPDPSETGRRSHATPLPPVPRHDDPLGIVAPDQYNAPTQYHAATTTQDAEQATTAPATRQHHDQFGAAAPNPYDAPTQYDTATTTQDGDRATEPLAAVDASVGVSPVAHLNAGPTPAERDEWPTEPLAAQGGSRRAARGSYGGPPRPGAGAGGVDPSAAEGGRARLLTMVCAGAGGLSMADAIAGTLVVSVPAPAFTGTGVTEADLQWVVTAYAVPFAALLVASGRLADLVGRRRLLAIGLGLFGLGAAAAAVAVSFAMLLAARAVQGVGSAAVVPASLGLLLAGVPAHRRAGAIGAWLAAAGIGGFGVHLAGGWLLGFGGWRAMFVPSAVIGTLLVHGTLALRRDAATSGRLPDPVGAVALLASVGTAVLAIAKGPQWGWSPALAALCAGGLLMLLVAVFRSARHPVPVLTMSLWRTPMFGLAGAVSLLHGLIAFPVLIVAPLFLHRVWGYDLGVAALAMAPLSGGVLVAGYLSGRLCRRYGPRVVIYTGSLLVAVSATYVITHVLQSEPRLLTVWSPASVLLGVGLGAMTTGASAGGAMSAPPAEYVAAIGGTMTARLIGGAIGTAAAAVLVGRALVDDALSGYIAVFGGCVLLAGVAGLVAMFIRPQPFAGGTYSTALAPGTAGNRLASPALPVSAATAHPRSPTLTEPPALEGSSASGIPVAPNALSSMPLSAPVPGDYEPFHGHTGHSGHIGHSSSHTGHATGHNLPDRNMAETPATTLRITGPHLPVPSAPAAPPPEPRPRTRRRSGSRSAKPKDRSSQRPKDRAQAESDLRAAATHFLNAADRLTVPNPALPQYYLPGPSTPESSAPVPSTPEPSTSRPSAPESHTPTAEPSTPDPAATRRRMPYARPFGESQ